MNKISENFEKVLNNYNKNVVSTFFTHLIPKFRTEIKYQASYIATYDKKRNTLTFSHDTTNSNDNDTITFLWNKERKEYVINNDADYSVPSNFDDEDDYEVIYNYSSDYLNLFDGKLNLAKIKALFNKKDGYFKDFAVNIV